MDIILAMVVGVAIGGAFFYFLKREKKQDPVLSEEEKVRIEREKEEARQFAELMAYKGRPRT